MPLAIGGCDKNMPGSMIAIANMNIPAIFRLRWYYRPESMDGKTSTWFLYLKVSVR